MAAEAQRRADAEQAALCEAQACRPCFSNQAAMRSSAGLTDLSRGMLAPAVDFMQLSWSECVSYSRLLPCHTA